MSQIKKDLNGKPLTDAAEDKSLSICWKGKKPFKSVGDVKNYFKPLALSFTNAKNVQLQLSPEAYLIVTVSTSANPTFFFFANPTIFIPAIRKANKEKSYETCISLPFQRHGNVCLGILNGQEVGLGNLNLIGGNPGKSKTSCYTHPVQFPLIYSLLVQTFLCKIKWWFMITRSGRLDGLLQIATGFLSPEPFSCNCLPLL